MQRRMWLLIAVAVLALVGLRAGSLTTGLHMDDLAQRAMVHDDGLLSRPAWDLYTFASGEPQEVRALASAGALPWWSHPELRLRSLRPLSSLTIWVDASCWGATAAHVHSLLWWLFMLGAALWALRPALGLRWALVAVGLYALDDAHVYPIAWLANRAALVSCAFGWLALGAYVRHARGTGPRWPIAAWASLSLAGGEYAFGVLAFLMSFAMLADARCWPARVRTLAPTVVVVLVYLACHRGFGFGADHSDVYVDPAAQPAAFAAAWARRAPALWIDMLTGASQAWIADVVPDYGGLWLWAIAGTAALVVAFAVASKGVQLRGPGGEQGPDSERRSPMAWLLVGAVLALVPVSASFLSERLTVAASLGTHAVFAGLVLRAFDAARQGGGRQRLGFIAVASCVLSGHVLAAARSGVKQQNDLRRFNAAGLMLADAMPAQDERAASEHWVLLTAGDPMMMVYTPRLRASSGHPPPMRWTVLSMSRKPLAMRRVSERALELTGPVLDSPLVGFFRASDEALALGSRIELEGLVAEVTAVDEGGQPQQIVFTFDAPVGGAQVPVWSIGTRGFVRYPMAGPGAQMLVPPGIDAIRAASAGG